MTLDLHGHFLQSLMLVGVEPNMRPRWNLQGMDGRDFVLIQEVAAAVAA